MMENLFCVEGWKLNLYVVPLYHCGYLLCLVMQQGSRDTCDPILTDSLGLNFFSEVPATQLALQPCRVMRPLLGIDSMHSFHE